MTTRKSRRHVTETKPKMKQGAKVRLIIMIISLIIMVFSVTQVYYLAKYTFGYEVHQDKLKVYIWISKLLEGNATQQ